MEESYFREWSVVEPAEVRPLLQPILPPCDPVLLGVGAVAQRLDCLQKGLLLLTDCTTVVGHSSEMYSKDLTLQLAVPILAPSLLEKRDPPEKWTITNISEMDSFTNLTFLVGWLAKGL